ncbi:MAG TPA: DUF4142 domain-containing protein [Gemmatimonadaceae bacterium]|nr:DUF4142 domain-containing protein [Gemmatimonadaceae bacterium]
MACTSEGNEAAAREPDTTGRRDSIAAVAAASMDEPQVLGLLAHVHASDSALGSLGANQGSTRQIKDFGLMISREHHALHRDLDQLAEGLRLTATRPRIAPDEAPRSFSENLNASQAGASWDRAYIEYSIAVHEGAMENTARALAATKSPATRDFIRKSVPILQKHLDKALSLQKTLAQAQPAPGTKATP